MLTLTFNLHGYRVNNFHLLFIVANALADTFVDACILIHDIFE